MILFSIQTNIHPQEKVDSVTQSIGAQSDWSKSNSFKILIRNFNYKPADPCRPISFDTNAFNKLLVKFTTNRMDSTDLEVARRRLTHYMVTNGYFNSGALIMDQEVTNETLTFTIVEGRLKASDLYIHGTHRLSTNYFKKRILRNARQPVQLNKLRTTLEVLRKNPNVGEITAEILPKRTNNVVILGESTLDLRVREASPYELALNLHNGRPPSIGAEILEMEARHNNLSGHSDVLRLYYGIAERSRPGFAEFSEWDNVGLSYAVPVSSRDTTIKASYERRGYAVVEEPFNQLDIESRYHSFGFQILQPFYRAPGQAMTLGLGLDRRHSETSIQGLPFSFSPGAQNGKMDVTVVHFTVDWNRSWKQQSLALRLNGRWGLDALGSTRSNTGQDSRFMSVSGQAQYLRRMWPKARHRTFREAHGLLRGTYQWADNPLLPMEQFSIGGFQSLRGYREFQIVRDTGALAGAELRIPLAWGKGDLPLLQVAPFYDFGAGWNRNRDTPKPNTLSSIGLGLMVNLGKQFQARLDWGYALRDLTSQRDDLQDHGLHFRITSKIY